MTAQPRPSAKYEVVREFTAYIVQNAGSTEDPRILEKGAIIWADAGFWEDRPRESALVVRFLCDDSWFYVDRETFVDCTRKA